MYCLLSAFFSGSFGGHQNILMLFVFSGTGAARYIPFVIFLCLYMYIPGLGYRENLYIVPSVTRRYINKKLRGHPIATIGPFRFRLGAVEWGAQAGYLLLI